MNVDVDEVDQNEVDNNIVNSEGSRRRGAQAQGAVESLFEVLPSSVNAGLTHSDTECKS